jgi:large subunit ribosomal protein L14e
MAPVQTPSTFKRFVEVGRVVLVNDGPSAGKLAVIAEIIDHNRALIDGPSTSVTRQSIPYRSLILTPYTLPALPRAAGTGAIRSAFDKAEVQSKWEGSSWSKKLVARDVRRKANDFERFEVGLLKRQRREQVRKAHFKERKSTA